MKKSRITGVLRLLALALIVYFVWAFVRDRLSFQNWSVPPEYTGGDGMQILGWIKAASEGDYIPFWTEMIQRLGAPYQANWNDYPMYEKILTFCLGMLSRWIGLFAASNFGVVLGHITSAISFYCCCRLLKYARIWSFVGAILFSLTYYHFLRNLSHLLLAYSYTIPFAIVSCWLIASSKGMRWGDRFAWVCLVTAFVMGLSNPYNLNLYVQLLCFSILAQFLGSRRKENLKIGLVSLGLAGAAFIAVNLGTLSYEWAHGKNEAALGRHYFEAELYALKPMELLIPPPTHNLGFLADIGNQYKAAAFVKGEMFSAYLGLVVIAGLIWIFADAFLLIVKDGKRLLRFPPHSLQIIWIIFYSIIGGVNCIISLGGIHLFRGTDRYSIFISAIVLLFLVSRASAWSRRKQISLGMALGLAAVVLVVGIVDQVPKPLAPEETIASAMVIEADRAFCHKMEEKLPVKAMVFQLPVMSFPEGGPIREIGEYEMLRPYYFTKTLHFSFGSVRGRPREEWMWEVEKLPPTQMISTLEKYGFAAIYLNRKGYADHGEALLKQFDAAGRNQIIEDDRHEQVCVLLNPSARPELPHTDDRALLTFRSGWAIKEQTPLENRQWAGGNATLSFFSEQKPYTGFSFKCLIGSISPRHVTILMKGKELWSAEIPAGQAVPVNITVIADRGKNMVEFKTDEKPVQPKEANVALTFTVVNLQITKLP